LWRWDDESCTSTMQLVWVMYIMISALTISENALDLCAGGACRHKKLQYDVLMY
jgi:hypothetical protein